MDIKAHRLELVVLDFDMYGVEEYIYNIRNQICGQVISHQTCDIPDYDDSHPLNSTQTKAEEKRKFFQIPEDGSLYVNREVKPDSELEALVKSLIEENNSLKAKLRNIANEAKL